MHLAILPAIMSLKIACLLRVKLPVPRCHYYCRRLIGNDVRVRFAPSPTGHLHLGGLRTALYNYLYARSMGGKFILRIEDTDQSRLVPGAVEKLNKMLEWAGICVDEGPLHGGKYGPYIQSQRNNLYWEMVQHLLQNGTAYYCFCTPKRLELLKKEALKRRETPKYDNRCRHLTAEEVESKLKLNTQYVIRFKLDHYNEPWNDIVYGPIVSDVASIEGDPVLLKTDRHPTYHFANVVDDHHMSVTHVLRGVEWQVSTTKHILLYNAFGWQPPQFAHLPLILNKDGSKLSKRQNDIHVEHLKNCGYFPEVVINLLTTMGGGFKVKNTAGMTMDQLIHNFDLTKLKTNSSRLDMEKVGELSKLHIENTLKEPQEKTAMVSLLRDLVEKQFEDRLVDSDLQRTVLSEDYIVAVLAWAKDRIITLQDLLAPKFEFIWLVPSSATTAHLPGLSADVPDSLSMTIKFVTQQQEHEFGQDNMTEMLNEVVKVQQMKYGAYMRMLRAALSGPKEGPSVSEMMSILGKQHTLQRLQLVLSLLKDDR